MPKTEKLSFLIPSYCWERLQIAAIFRAESEEKGDEITSKTFMSLMRERNPQLRLMPMSFDISGLVNMMYATLKT